MISLKDIHEWGKNVKWTRREMVEHDLIISKALVRLYQDPTIQENLVFRGEQP